jgi:hypothetical protein
LTLAKLVSSPDTVSAVKLVFLGAVFEASEIALGIPLVNFLTVVV